MSAAHSTSLPLARLLDLTADAVAAVRAGRSLTEVLARVPADARPGVQSLSFHVMRWLGGAGEVRAILAPKTPPPNVESLLLTALALLWPVPHPPYAEHTLVDQAVSAARQRTPAAAAFVNAVLRRFLRERAAQVAQAERRPEAAWNHPAWWVAQVQADWPEHWQTILGQARLRPPMALRVNARRCTVPDYLARLQAAGLSGQAVAGPGWDQAIVLDAPVPVERLPGFDEGWVSVQDLAAQRAAALLLGEGLPAGARVLDACAAPGGKTAHLLERADLDLLALDADPARLARVGEGLARLGLRARTQAADARAVDAWWDGQPFDAILLDAPCSASGIVRRHPDIAWLRRPEDIPALARIQAELLDALWPLLKPGGRLLYATCSVFKAEGQAQIDAFLQRHGLSPACIFPVSPGHLLPLPDNQDATSAPAPVARADGFFYALLGKPAASGSAS
jgi:16S rRNA (cytosine967-C5)-methyltransferase